MGQAATWEKVLEFKDAYPSFQLEDELFLNWGGGVLWTHLSERRISAGPSQGGLSRRQKKERAAALEDGRCCTPSLECAELGIKSREIRKVNQSISGSILEDLH
jgi:hypothetical protein